MNRGFFFVLAAALWTGAFAQEIRQHPLIGPDTAGWKRVELDAAAQAVIATAWIADFAGVPVPFVREASLSPAPRQVPLSELVTGRTDDGTLMAEFRVSGTGEETGNLTFEVSLDAKPPWVVETEVALRRAGGEWITVEKRQHLYDFGREDRRKEVVAERMAGEWRLRFRVVQGRVEAVLGVTASMERRPTGPVRRVQAGLSRGKGGWILDLGPQLQRVAVFEINFAGVVAPVRADFYALREVDGDWRAEFAGGGLVWKMPGLSSEERRVEFKAPLTGRRWLVSLPENAVPSGAVALVREESLWFVAEQGKQYFLHLGGRVKPAAGDLQSLPGFTDLGAAPLLRLGPPGPDPFGAPVEPDIAEKLQPWLPVIVGVLVAVLAVAAWRLLKPARPTGNNQRRL